MTTPDADFADLPRRYLGRDWRPEDAMGEAELAASESRLGTALPLSLRRFYLALGGCDELLSAHNVIRRPAELAIIDDHLVFADENQGVVSWGFRIEDVRLADPDVWQQVHDGSAPEPWYSEEVPLRQFLADMLDFTFSTD